MKRIFFTFLLIVLAIFFFGMIGPQENRNSVQTVESSQKSPFIPVGKINQATLEEFLSKNNASPEITQAYRFALENPQSVLSKVKCYCGCLKQDHKNNLHCFFNDDGSIDLMGLNCGLCVKTALVSKQMLAENKSVDEIANYVDNRWGKN